jgi:hypothetical protein
MSVYHERQRGGLCRLHSINAYFGERMYSDEMFHARADEFDAIQKSIFGSTTSCRSFDLINSDQRNLVSYVLGKHGVYVRYVAINLHADHIDDAVESGCFFVFNLDHIWVVKKKDNVWYKIDSMGGVGRINPLCISREKNVGIMIPIANPNLEFARLAKQIDIAVNGDALRFIRVNHANKKILGDVEIYLGALIAILQVQRAGRLGFVIVDTLIYRYTLFVQELCIRNRYNDLAFLELEVPPILAAVTRLLSDSC